MFEEIDKLLKSSLLNNIPLKDSIKLYDGERREVSILFADIKGFTSLSEKLDPEQVRMIIDKLFQLFTMCIKKYGGYIDKYEGDLVMALFGAKVASEKDTERAVLSGLEMLDKLEQFNDCLKKMPNLKGNKFGIRIGINTGLVTTGRVGEKREGDFTVYGDAVNLASRMESNAPIDRIMLPKETMKLVEEIFEFEDYGEIKVKGKSKLISVYLVKGLIEKEINYWQTSKFVGREKELDLLEEKFKEIRKEIKNKSKTCNKPVVIGIKGQAGLGKSRLVFEFLKKENRSKFVLYGVNQSVIQNPYSIFISMIKKYLNIKIKDSQEVLKSKLETEFDKLSKNITNKSNLKNIIPMIGYLLGIKYDDIRIKLEAADLQKHIQIALKLLIEAKTIMNNNMGKPLIIVFEDFQWLDEASNDAIIYLFQTLNFGIKNKNIMFVFTYREEYKTPDIIKDNSFFTEIILSPLNNLNMDDLVYSMTKKIKLNKKQEEQLMEKSAGNPFYLEEWVNLVRNLQDIKNTDNLPIPKTLNALILSRIDCLPKDVKLLLQKASVIGKEFLLNILNEIERKLDKTKDISEILNSLEEKDLIYHFQNFNYSSYFFKHIITQEVAYNTLLISNRKILHRIIAEVIEEQFPEKITEFYYDLAYHYEKAEVKSKTVEYLEKAGDKAKKNFENKKAIEFYNRLLEFFKGCEKEKNKDKKKIVHYINILFKKGSILQLIGKWDSSDRIFKKSLNLSKSIKHKYYISMAYKYLSFFFYNRGDYKDSMEYCNLSLKLLDKNDKELGIIYRYIGNNFYRQAKYSKAMEFCKKSIKLAQNYDNKTEIANSLSAIGDIYRRTGKYNKAMSCYKKGLKISELLCYKRGIAQAIANIGIIYSFQNNLNKALEFYDKFLYISEELGDKKRISAALGNIGIVYRKQYKYSKAMLFYKRRLKISKELGDKNGVLQTIGNIGNIYFDKGNYLKAIEFLKKQLKLSKESDDKDQLIVTLENIGYIYKELGDYKNALKYYEKKLVICKELNNITELSYVYNALSIVYMDTLKYEDAMKYIDLAINIAKEEKNKEQLCENLYTKALIYFFLNKYKKAKNLIDGIDIKMPNEVNFKIDILNYKIKYKLEKNIEIIFKLKEMLKKEKIDKNKAQILFNLWEMLKDRQIDR